MRGTCSIEGCGKVLKGNGYCHKHNTRFRLHGSPYIVNNNYNLPPGEAGLNLLYYQYELRAKKYNREFHLNKDEFKSITSKDCFYCKSPPNSKTRVCGTKGIYTYNGIDRIDNEQGYTIENSVPCCKFCNYAKNKFQVTEFTEWLDYVRSTK